MAAERSSTPTTPQQGPRLRFAKNEIRKALTALERATDGGKVDAWMRCLELEDRLEDTRKDLEEVRSERDTLRRLVAEMRR